MSSSRILSVLALTVCCSFGLAHAKPAVTKPSAKPVESKPLEAANAEQLAAAERTLFGVYACEFNQTVNVAMNPKTVGYVDVKFKGKTLTMKPVLSSTGALRLEDVTGRTLMIQIASKSMLLDVKAGQRLVDECLHPEQAAFKPA